MAEIEKSEVIYKKALRLAKLDKEFKLIKVNNTFHLESEYFGNSTSRRSTKMNPSELGFIKRVKNYVVKNEIYLNFVENFYNPKDIRYISISRKKPASIYENIIEIDIDEAYWKTSHILGVINDAIYHEGSKSGGTMKKNTRLVALGSLAKKIDIYWYKGNSMVKRTQERSVLTENIWYSLCKTISDLMWEAKKIAGNDFFLYWVDGIYIRNKPEKVEAITELFKKHGYQVKYKTDLRIEYTEKTAIIHNEISGSERPFFIPNNSNYRTYFPDMQLKETCFKYMKYGAVTED